ncbi:pilin [Permianibacter aggregans]|uniref:Pilin n=1 Tax=Permianibacter aggregans TaxID=1510150 RepID=A0A4R6UD94_9GAMM|nr:pilin [Permianibacter aggregans]QGX39014.1 prepilin-type N-terminal cleavage/methylation domain-containing protein [Permianibacter aggregans]TDQ44648.1 type IV pilus assembly protein PilA [Permianibacter aggregans]
MKTQKGFTLIELMIVVAIIGILAAVALPAYQDYLKRSKLSEVAAAIGACKTSVAEYQAARNEFPANADDAGCSTGATQYVASLAVADGTGVISATIQNVGTGANGETLSLAPCSNDDPNSCTAATDSSSIQSWYCYTSAAATDYKLFPATCRNAG